MVEKYIAQQGACSQKATNSNNKKSFIVVPILLNISLDGAVILGMCEISLAKSSVKALAHKSESLANMP